MQLFPQPYIKMLSLSLKNDNVSFPWNLCSFAFQFNQHFVLNSFSCVFCQYFEKKLFSQIPNLHQRAMCDHRGYAMACMTVLTRVTKKCAIVLRTIRSNVIVTSLMMVVQGCGDAQDK